MLALLAPGERRAARRLRDPPGQLGGGGDLAVADVSRPRPCTSPPEGLTCEPATARPDAARRRSTVGADAGSWLPYGNPADLPGDQRGEDAWSLCFDSAPLAGEIELLGQPSVSLRVSADRPVAFVAVRLCEVRPDGTSTLITRGALNLCHRTATIAGPARAGPRLRRRGAAEGDRVRAAAGSPAAVAHLDDLLAVALAVARARRARRHTARQASRLELPVRPRARGRRPPAVRERRRSPRRCPSRGSPSAIRAGRSPGTSSRGSTPLVMSRALAGSRRFPNGITYRDRDPVRFSIVEGDRSRPASSASGRSRSVAATWQTRVEMRATHVGRCGGVPRTGRSTSTRATVSSRAAPTPPGSRATAAEARWTPGRTRRRWRGELDAIVDLTRRLVEIDSPTDAPDGVGAVCEILGRAARDAGCEVEAWHACRVRAAARRATATRRRRDDPGARPRGHRVAGRHGGGLAVPWRRAAGSSGPGVGDMKCCVATAVHAIAALGPCAPPGLGTVRLLVVPGRGARAAPPRGP